VWREETCQLRGHGGPIDVASAGRIGRIAEDPDSRDGSRRVGNKFGRLGRLGRREEPGRSGHAARRPPQPREGGCRAPVIQSRSTAATSHSFADRQSGQALINLLIFMVIMMQYLMIIGRCDSV